MEKVSSQEPRCTKILTTLECKDHVKYLSACVLLVSNLG